MTNFEYKDFTFKKGQGIVWVCDVKDSTKHLNNDYNYVAEYLSRLHWISAVVINSFNGEFIKWTGDGFLAWFEVDKSSSNIQSIFNNIINAAFQLSLINNTTQLGLDTNSKISIKHAVTYEKNARIINIKYRSGHTSRDLIGKDVVLAFRLTGIPTRFPNLCTVKDLAKSDYDSFYNWSPDKNDILKYFKGEKRSTSKIFIKRNVVNKTSQSMEIDDIINKAEGKTDNKTSHLSPIISMINHFTKGPEWCNEVYNQYTSFLKDELLETLKKAREIIKHSHTNKK